MCDVLYAVFYVHVSCFVVRGCAVSRRYINVCNCDMFGELGLQRPRVPVTYMEQTHQTNMFSVVNVYLDHLKLCGVY